MFFHQFKYTVRRLLHTPAEIIWVLLFPIILGTLFHVAFSNILDSKEKFHVIPTAIVLGDTSFSDNFKEIADELGEKGDDQLLDITYTEFDHAKKLLRDKKVSGIITVDESAHLTISDSSGTLRMQQTILESFVKQYNVNSGAITTIATSQPEHLQNSLLSLSENTSYLVKKNLTSGNMDFVIQYFFNLIAMACLYTSFAGCQISIRTQANLSHIGARRMVSPNSRAVTLIAEFFANLLVQFGSLCLVLLYLIAVLKVDFGERIGLTICSILMSCALGISLGMFVGSISHIGENVKMGLLVGVSMLFCFLSGLMVDTVRPIIEKFCPLINRLNPAVRISDSFYSLSIYDTYERFFGNVIAIFLYTLLFLVGTFLVIRRDKYASL